MVVGVEACRSRLSGKWTEELFRFTAVSLLLFSLPLCFVLGVCIKMPRKFVVGGNWKCNGTKASIKALCEEFSKLQLPEDANVEVIIAPSSVHAEYTKSLLPPVYKIALQNCWIGKGGAFTGETSAEMIKDMVRKGLPESLFGKSLLYI